MSATRSVAALMLLIMGLWRPVLAEQVSILQAASFPAQRAALFELKDLVPGAGKPDQLASLFAGREGGSLFAPYPERQTRTRGADRSGLRLNGTDRLLHLIGQAEAGSQGYDAIQHGAVRLPAKRPTEMTIAEILAWIEQTPGQHHAIGRYQFIPVTLRRLIEKLGVGAQEVFAPSLQDRLADALLAEAGLEAVRNGSIKRHAFMHNMAKIWAGLPTSSGASYYEGIAGNMATMTWAHFDAEMEKIFPG